MRAERVIVFHPGALGDTLLTVGALAGLRQAFPGALIELVGHNGAAALLRRTGVVDAASAFDSLQVASLFLSPPLVSLRWQGARLVVLWLRRADSIGSAFEAAGAEGVIAADPEPADPKLHVADHLVQTLAGAGVTTPSPWPKLDLPRREDGIGWASEGRAVVHPGSGSPRKNWSPHGFAMLLDELKAWGNDPLLVAGPADDAAVGEVVGGLRGERIETIRPASVRALAELLAGATLYVGNDSGVSHLAALLGVPTVVLFGATDPARWAPRGERVRMLGRLGGWPSLEEVLACGAELLHRTRVPRPMPR